MIYRPLAVRYCHCHLLELHVGYHKTLDVAESAEITSYILETNYSTSPDTQE